MHVESRMAHQNIHTEGKKVNKSTGRAKICVAGTSKKRR